MEITKLFLKMNINVHNSVFLFNYLDLIARLKLGDVSYNPDAVFLVDM